MVDTINSNSFEIGRVISRTIATCRDSFKALIALPLILLGGYVLISSLISSAILGGVDPLAAESSLLIYSLISGIIYLLVTCVVQSGMISAADKALRLEPVTFGESFQTGLKLCFPFLVLSILLGIAVSLASLLLLVPGIILMCMWAVAGPSYVLDSNGIGAAFSSSSALTKGYRLKIFLLFVIYGIAAIALSLIPSFAFGFMATQAAGGVPALSPIYVIYVIITMLLTVILSLVGTVGITSLYHELVMLKHGTGPNSIEGTFS